jgi:hypothetical protein
LSMHALASGHEKLFRRAEWATVHAGCATLAEVTAKGRRRSGQSDTADKIATTTTKVRETAVAVGRIGYATKLKARLLTGLCARTNRHQNSEFGRQISVDLEADADFDECWGSPSHAYPPLGSWQSTTPFRAKRPAIPPPSSASCHIAPILHRPTGERRED